MEFSQMAMCGLDCGVCIYKKDNSCPGCSALKGKMFWGRCRVALCCAKKNLAHCGQCKFFPCDKLMSFAYDKEHGDADGSRIQNIKNRMKQEKDNQ